METATRGSCKVSFPACSSHTLPKSKTAFIKLLFAFKKVHAFSASIVSISVTSNEITLCIDTEEEVSVVDKCV